MNTLLIAGLVSQNLFGKVYGGFNFDQINSIAQTPDGGYIVSGYSNSYATSYDFLVFKINSNGSPEWARTFGGSFEDASFSLAVAPDSGYWVGGRTRSYGAGNIDFLILRLGPSGAPMFAKTIGGYLLEFCWSISPTSDGGLISAGCASSYSPTYNLDPFIVKTRPDGSIEWARTIEGDNGGEFLSVIQTVDGGYAITGITPSFGSDSFDILVVKTDPAGNIQWARAYGGIGYDWGMSIIQTFDGGYAVAGTLFGYNAAQDVLVLKFSAGGTLEWARIIGGSGNDFGYSIIQTSDSGYVISARNGGPDLMLIKLGYDGSLLWAKTLGESNWDEANKTIELSDGSLAVAGYTGSWGSGQYDCLILRLDKDGNNGDCLKDTTVQINTPPLSAREVSPASVPQTPILMTQTPNTSTPSLSVSDVCPTNVEERESLPSERVICSPGLKHLLFLAPFDVLLRIYSPDGRLAYSGNLVKGENRITLDQGVYLWQAGVVGTGPRARPVYKGKAIVR